MAPLEWIKLDITGVRAGRISMASLAAKGLWLELLTLAAQTGDIVTVSADVRYLARQTGSDAAAVKDALEELVEIGSVTLDGGLCVIHGADDIQDAVLRQREGNRTRQKRRRDRARGATAEAPATDDHQLDAGMVRTRLWEALDGVIADGIEADDAVRMYERMYDDAVKAAEPGGRYADVKGVGSASLTNVVVAHAAHRWLGTQADDVATQRRLAAIRKNHGPAVLRALPAAATGAKGDPLAYLQGILSKGGAR